MSWDTTWCDFVERAMLNIFCKRFYYVTLIVDLTATQIVKRLTYRIYATYIFYFHFHTENNVQPAYTRMGLKMWVFCSGNW